MRLINSESEKQRIKDLYNQRLLFEQTGDVTIGDLQKLIGVTADGEMGNITAKTLLEVLKTIPGNGCSASGNRPVPDVGGNKGFNPYQQTDFSK